MNTLEKICADKEVHVAQCKKMVPLVVLEEKIRYQSPPRGFCAAITARKNEKKSALIAEVKKASPSKGIIRADFDPAHLAHCYDDAGADCVSVLTDTPYFQGQDRDLETVRRTITRPLLRKDFMLDPYQIIESRALGADCILLIMAALTDDKAKELYDTAVSYGMDVLIEVHDEKELERALTLNPMMVGVNARNLKTLVVDLQTAFALVHHIPPTTLRVAESGITTRAQRQSLFEAGFDAFLIGEHFMRQDDIPSAVKNMMGRS